MKRNILASLLVVFGLFLVSTKSVSANEGVFRLAGSKDGDGRCFATSIFLDGNFRVLMTCRNLRMAIDPVTNRFVAWAQAGDKYYRLGEIVNGKLESAIESNFSRIVVTVERSTYNNAPANDVYMAGNLEAIDFGGGVIDSNQQTNSSQVSSSQSSKVSSQQSAVSSSQSSNKVLTVITGIGKAILIGFLLLLVVVGVLGFLARRKSL